MEKICWLRAFRCRHRITIAELSCCAGISPQLLSLIELDPGRQTKEQAAKLHLACIKLAGARRREAEQMEEELASCPGIFLLNGGEKDGA